MEGQDVALVPGCLFEIFDVQRRTDGVHITAENAAREIHGRENTAARSGRNRVVDRVVRVRGNDVAGSDALGRVRAGNATEVDVLGVRLRGIGLGYDVALVKSVGNADAREAVLDGIAGRDIDAF